MIAMGLFSVSTSIMIFVFKREINPKKMAIPSEREQMEKVYEHIKSNTIKKAYLSIKEILCNRPIHKVIFLFMTYRVY
jgi:hypothetical protein